mmetsp:Transcript_137952/g.440589  ORF Transcript_137952/g.440589 Transcript_137952/m.440589 type:complete len:426 (+) Transcript_137952:2770-4047(+)
MRRLLCAERSLQVGVLLGDAASHAFAPRVHARDGVLQQRPHGRAPDRLRRRDAAPEHRAPLQTRGLRQHPPQRLDLPSRGGAVASDLGIPGNLAGLSLVPRHVPALRQREAKRQDRLRLGLVIHHVILGRQGCDALCQQPGGVPGRDLPCVDHGQDALHSRLVGLRLQRLPPKQKLAILPLLTNGLRLLHVQERVNQADRHQLRRLLVNAPGQQLPPSGADKGPLLPERGSAVESSAHRLQKLPKVPQFAGKIRLRVQGFLKDPLGGGNRQPCFGKGELALAGSHEQGGQTQRLRLPLQDDLQAREAKGASLGLGLAVLPSFDFVLDEFFPDSLPNLKLEVPWALKLDVQGLGGGLEEQLQRRQVGCPHLQWQGAAGPIQQLVHDVGANVVLLGVEALREKGQQILEHIIVILLLARHADHRQIS